MEGTFDEAVQRYIRNNGGFDHTVESISYLFEMTMEEAYEQALRDGRYCQYYDGSWVIRNPDVSHAVPCLIAAETLHENPSNVKVLDVETTGLDPGADEVLSIAIVDGNGDTVFNSLVHPYNVKEWPEAQEINGIAPSDVRDTPYMAGIRREIQTILDDTTVLVGYNHMDFDMCFLSKYGIAYRGNWCDVMRDFLPIGARDDGEYRYRSLVKCANHYGHYFHAHDALEDAKATLYCCLRIAEEQIRTPELVRIALPNMRFGGLR